MIASASPRLAAYAALAALGLVAALGAGRPEFAALAAPFALFVVVALAGATVALDGGLRLECERVLEGEQASATASVISTGAAARVELYLPTSPRLRADPVATAFWLPGGARRDVRFELDVSRWGVHEAGPALIRAAQSFATPFIMNRPAASAASTTRTTTTSSPTSAIWRTTIFRTPII